MQYKERKSSFKKIIGFIFILIVVACGVFYYINKIKKEKEEAIIKLENQRMTIGATYYIMDLKIPFYDEEEGRIEELFNNLVTAQVVKIKPTDIQLKTNNEDKSSITIEKTFTNYKDVPTIVSELDLDKELVLKYLNENNYTVSIEEGNIEKIQLLLNNLALEEKYREIANLFSVESISQAEMTALEDSLPADIMIIGMDKIAVLNNFSVLKAQEILKTIVEYTTFVYTKEADDEYNKVPNLQKMTVDEFMNELNSLLFVRGFEINQSQKKILENNMLELKNEVKKTVNKLRETQNDTENSATLKVNETEKSNITNIENTSIVENKIGDNNEKK